MTDLEAAWNVLKNWVNCEPENGWGSLSLSEAVLYALREEESAKIETIKRCEDLLRANGINPIFLHHT